MADSAPTSARGSPTPQSPLQRPNPKMYYKKNSRGVVTLLQPSIVQAVEQALSKALADIKKYVMENSQAITELE